MYCYYSLHFTDDDAEAQSIDVAFFHPSSLICSTENTTSLNTSWNLFVSWRSSFGWAHLDGGDIAQAFLFLLPRPPLSNLPKRKVPRCYWNDELGEILCESSSKGGMRKTKKREVRKTQWGATTVAWQGWRPVQGELILWDLQAKQSCIQQKWYH